MRSANSNGIEKIVTAVQITSNERMPTQNDHDVLKYREFNVTDTVHTYLVARIADPGVDPKFLP